MPSVSQCVYMQMVLASINTPTFNIWGRRTKDNRGDRKTQEKIENNSQIRRTQGENELITETMSQRGMGFISSSITTMAFLWLASNKPTPKEKLYSKNLTFIYKMGKKNGQRKCETKEIQQRSELPRAMPHVGGFPSSQF